MTSFKVLSAYVTPAEGEDTVRTYHCTSLSSMWLRLKAEGYLTVTNKRVIFYGFGSSYGGTSIFLSEVPIADVSGISSYKGTYFSLTHLVVAGVVSFIVGNIINAIVNTAILFLTRNPGALDVVALVVPLLVIGLSGLFERDKIWRPIFASTGALLAFWLGGISLTSSFFGGFSGRGESGIGAVVGLVAVIGGLYALATFFWYARRETMSLTVGSKGGSSTPITVSGISGFGLYNTAALRALTAEPAIDAEPMIKQLGAIITDVQTLGDMGIQKWKTT